MKQGEQTLTNQINYSTLLINTPDFQSVSTSIPLTLVNSGAAAKTAIMDTQRRFAAIFLDPVMPHAGSLEILKLAHKYRPATPVYLVYRKEKPFPDTEMPRLAVHEQIRGPLTAAMIQQRISSKIFEFSFEPPTLPQLDSPARDDRKFTAVPISDFLTGSTSIYDVYVRLPSGRYFKILDAKDCFAPERILGYMQKGVNHLYLANASMERCLSYCDILARFLISNKAVSLEMKTTEIFNKGQQLIHSILVEGLTEDHFEYAVTFVAQVHSLLSGVDVKNKSHISMLLENVVLYDRAVSTAMLCGLLALPLKIESESAFRAIGLAALLHDIGILALPEELRNLPWEQMSPTQQELYKTHPAQGAAMLSQIPLMDSVSIQAVAQHHERRNKKGYPGKVSSSEINRVAELIGISNDFLDLLNAAKKDKTLYPLAAIEKVFDGYSFPVIESFRTLFLATKSQP